MNSLPCDLWQLIVAAILGPWAATRNCNFDDDPYPGRWQDLVRLGWTCRDAYFAAHLHIWRTLRAVPYMVGDEGQVDQKKLEYPGRQQEPHLAHFYERQTRALMESTVFPCVAKPVQRILADRIRSVTDKDQHFMFPFVVVDGLLYLASMVENEQSFDPESGAVNMDRISAGIESLWGRSMSVLVKGSLVCVPFPSHLVHQLAFGDLDWPHNFPDTTYPWLFAFPVNQVRSVQFHSFFSNYEIHRQLTPHYTAVTDWDFAYTAGDYCAADFPPNPTRLRIFRQNHDLDDSLPQAVGECRDLTHIEILGEGYFDPRWTGHIYDDEWKNIYSMFNLPNLQHLSLDYFISSSGGDYLHSHAAIYLPSLRSMCLAFDIAAFLFENDHLDTILAHPLDDGRIAFPCLTHLALVAYPSIPADRQKSRVQLCDLPRLPLVHMPKLTHLHVPCEHVGFTSRHRVAFEQLADWASHFKHLTSLRIPGIYRLARYPPVGAEAFTFPKLAELEVDLQLFFRYPDIAALMVTPNLQHITIHADRHDLPRKFLASCTKLESATVFAFEFMPSSWVTLAALPNLSTLAVTSKESKDFWGTLFDAVEPANVVADPARTGRLLEFPKLESLSYTMTHGSLDFSNIAFENVRRVALDMEHVPIGSFKLSTKLHKLQLSVASGLCLNTLRVALSPRMAHVFVDFMPGSAEPSVICVDWCQREPRGLLVLHYTGDVGNRASWRALRDAAPAVACALKDEAVLVVRFGEMEFKGQDLELVADVLLRVFARDGGGDGDRSGLTVRLEVVSEDGVKAFDEGSPLAKLRASGVQVECRCVADLE